MTIIQLILLLLAVVLLWYFTQRASLYSIRAWKRIGFLLLLIFMIASIAAPELTNKLAHLLGVGRGADLLLYFLAISFLFIVINIYMKFQDQSAVMYKIARHVAIQEAIEKRKQANTASKK